jgi:hypothetical protein
MLNSTDPVSGLAEWMSSAPTPEDLRQIAADVHSRQPDIFGTVSPEEWVIVAKRLTEHLGVELPPGKSV